MKYGAAHTKGLYAVPNGSGTQFTDGCDAIWDLGLRTLKVYCTSAYLTDYPLQSAWSSTPTTLTELCETNQFADQLVRDWDTVMMTCFTFANGVTNWWRVEPTNAKLTAEYNELKALAVHLLTEYNDSGKTFILQNWEGDWAFGDSFDPDSFIDRKYVDYYAAFAATRQRAVSDARAETAHVNVTVLNAFEVNRVLDAKDRPDARRIIYDLSKRFTPDVLSYSAYDSTIVKTGWGASQAAWEAACDEYYNLAFDIMQDAFPGVPIQIGEFGFPENEAPETNDVSAMIDKVREISLARGATHLIYWEVFDNEPSVEHTYRGYWLRKPNGDLSLAGERFQTYAAGSE